MEAMEAAGKKPSGVAVGELGEADGALHAVLECRGVEDGDWERFEHCGIERAAAEGGAGSAGGGEDEKGRRTRESGVGAGVAVRSEE